MASVHDFSARTIAGESQALAAYRGKTLLVVNVASKCRFTPQYQGLEQLYRRLGGRGLVVLGFPCDQFGHQEPGDETAIQEFCSVNYDVSFPLFAKVAVNGSGAHPLYRHLKTAAPGLLGSQAIKWNFTKFLVDGAGKVQRRYAPTVTPATIEQDLLALLAPA